MKKKFVLFAGAAVVITGGLLYVGGILPKQANSDTQGAIGQRQVYRDPQAHDVAVAQGAAPVVASTLSPAQQQKIHDMAGKIAASFTTNAGPAMNQAIQTNLIALLTQHQEVSSGTRDQFARDMSENFVHEFMYMVQSQLASAIETNLTQSGFGASLSQFSGNLDQMSSDMGAGAASNFVTQISSQVASQLAHEVESSVAHNISAGIVQQISSNVSHQLSSGFTNQIASSIAHNMTLQFANGVARN